MVGLIGNLNDYGHLRNFHATGLFWYSLKTSENQSFSDVSREYWKRPVAWNGLTTFPLAVSTPEGKLYQSKTKYLLRNYLIE